MGVTILRLSNKRKMASLGFIVLTFLLLATMANGAKRGKKEFGQSQHSVSTKPLSQSGLKGDTQVKAVAEGNSKFAYNLHGVLNGSEPGNLIFSPFSLSSVMAIAKLGSRGSTAKEIRKGMKFPENNGNNGNNMLRQGYAKIYSSFQNPSNESTGYILAAANKLYLKDGFSFRRKFEKAISSLNASVDTIKFENGVEAAQTINRWVESMTRDKIKDLISPGSLNADTRLVLVNGVYFKGQWKNKFLSARTTNAPFYVTQDDTVDVDMMTQKAFLSNSYMENLDADVVSLPYHGDRLTMIIYVPRTRTGLWKIEEGIRKTFPAQILRGMETAEKIQLFLPKFRIESTLNLVEPLKNLGMEKMFSRGEANFNAILKEQPLYVSQVVQKAFIEINEEGSEAAAASGMVFEARSFSPPPPQVRADRPFLFQIVDQWTKVLLLQGRLTNPTA